MFDQKTTDKNDRASHIPMGEQETFLDNNEYQEESGLAAAAHKRQTNWKYRTLFGFLGLSAATGMTRLIQQSGLLNASGRADELPNEVIDATDATNADTRGQSRFLSTLLQHTTDSQPDMQFANTGIADFGTDVSTNQFSGPEQEQWGPSDDDIAVQDITSEELQELLQLLAQTELSDEELEFENPGELDKSKRSKRSKRSPSERQTKGTSILLALWNIRGHFDHAKNFQTFLDKLYRKIEANEALKNNVYPDRNPYHSVKNYIKVLAKDMEELDNQYESDKSGTFDARYNDIYLALRLAWDIFEQETEPTEIVTINQYRDHLFTTYKLSNDDLTDLTAPHQLDELYFYLWSNYPSLEKAKIKRNEVFVLSNGSQVERFSLLNLTEGKHRAFLSSPELRIHRLSNYAAVPEPEIEAFVKDVSKEKYTQFLKSPQYADFITTTAHILLNAGLDKLEGSDRYINKKARQQQICKTQEISPALVTTTANQHLLRKMAEIIDTVPQWHYLQSNTILFAISELNQLRPHLFQNLNKNQVTLSSYAYSYSDVDGNTQFNCAPLEEILSKDTGDRAFAIARRDNVKIHYPPTFSPPLRQALDTLTSIVNDFYQDEKFKLLMQNLNIALPTLQEQLSKEHRAICKEFEIDNCDMSEKFEFELSKFLENSEKVTLTIGQILVGDLRRMTAKHYLYQPVISKFPEDNSLRIAQKYFTALNATTHASKAGTSAHSRENIQDLEYQYKVEKQHREERYTSYIKELNSNSLLEQLLNQLRDLAKDNELVEKFDDYTYFLKNSLEKKANITIHGVGEILNTPLLRVYFTKQPSWTHPDHKLDKQLDRQSEHYPIYLQSLVSGQTIKFDSLRQLRQEAERKEDFFKFIASHSYMDFLQSPRELNVVPLSSESSWDRVMEFRLKNIEKIIMSPSEANIYKTLEIIYDYRELITAPLLLYGGYGQNIAEIFISGAVPQLQKFVATRDDEHAELNQNSIKNVVADVAGAAIGKVGSTGTKYFFQYGAKTAIGKKMATSALAESLESIIADLEKFRNIIVSPTQSKQIAKQAPNLVPRAGKPHLLRKIPHDRYAKQELAIIPADQAFEKYSGEPFDKGWELLVGSYPDLNFSEIFKSSPTKTNQLDLTGNLGASQFEVDQTKLKKGSVIG